MIKTYDITADNFSEHVKDIDRLGRGAYSEVGCSGIPATFNMDYDSYHNLLKLGHLIIVGLANDNELIGFTSTFITNALYSDHVKHGLTHTMYIRPCERNASNFSKISCRVEERLKELGCEYHCVSVDIKAERVGRLLELQGFSLYDLTYSKKLLDK